jgi:hypothetical protein
LSHGKIVRAAKSDVMAKCQGRRKKDMNKEVEKDEGDQLIEGELVVFEEGVSSSLSKGRRLCLFFENEDANLLTIAVASHE